MSGGVESLKPRVAAAVDRLADELEALSHRIHDNPELAFNEHRSAGLLVEALRGDGFDVSAGTGGLETAFRAEHGTAEKPTVAVLAEYDALPGIGHACGHNLICTAAVTPLARAGTLAAAKAMAMTTYDLLSDPALVAKARREFESTKA